MRAGVQATTSRACIPEADGQKRAGQTGLQGSLDGIYYRQKVYRLHAASARRCWEILGKINNVSTTIIVFLCERHSSPKGDVQVRQSLGLIVLLIHRHGCLVTRILSTVYYGVVVDGLATRG